MAVNLPIRLSLQDQNKVRQGLRALGRDGERSLKRFEMATRGPNKGLLALDRSVVALGASARGMAASLGVFGGLASRLGPAGVALAATAASAVALQRGLTAIVQPSLNFLDALDKAAQVAGISAERLQELRFVNEQFGVSVRETDEAVRRFGRRIGEAIDGNQEYSKVLARLGIDIDDASFALATQEERLDQVIAALSEIEDESVRAARASRLFGEDAGPKLAVALGATQAQVDALVARLRDMGGVLDNDLIARGVRAKDELTALSRVIDANLAAAFVDFAPILISTTEFLAEAARAAADLADAFREIEERSTRGLTNQLATINRELERMRDFAAETAANLSRGDLDPLLAGRDAQALAFTQSEIRRLEAERARIEEILARREQGRTRPRLTSDSGSGGAREEERRVVAEFLEQQSNAARLARLEGEERALLEARIRATALARQEEADNLREVGRLTEDEARQLEDSIRFRFENQKAREAELELDRRATALRKEIATDQERLNALTEEYTELLAEGAVTQEEFERAMARARSELDETTKAGQELGGALTDLGREALLNFENMESALTSFQNRLLDLALDPVFDMIAQQISGAFGGGAGGGGIFGSLFGLFGGGGGGTASASAAPFLSGSGFFLHDGGIAGRDGVRRPVAASVFDSAPRLHRGGYAGLGPDEVPAILQVGERVLSRRETAALAANDNGVSVNIVIENHTGTPVEAEQRRGQDGEIRIILRQMVREEISSGGLDREFRSAFGSRPVLRR